MLLITTMVGLASEQVAGEQLIVRLRADAAKSARTPKAEIEKLSGAAGASLLYVRAMALGAHVVAIGDGPGQVDAEQIAARIAAEPLVEFAEVDYRRHAPTYPDRSADGDPVTCCRTIPPR